MHTVNFSSMKPHFDYPVPCRVPTWVNLFTIRTWILPLLCLSTSSLHAQLTETYWFDTFQEGPDNHLSIPDGNSAGVSDTRTITSSISTILSLEVSLNLASDWAQNADGAFNGDLYLYLRHESGFSVLLNRLGRSTLNPGGFDDSGVTIVLRDNASNGDIHFYRSVITPTAGTPLTGTWQPDGRYLVPTAGSSEFDSATRHAGLSVFQEMNANGEWVLFAADLQSGGATQIESWALQITGVPEPSRGSLGMALTLLVYSVWKHSSFAKRLWPAQATVLLQTKKAAP